MLKIAIIVGSTRPGRNGEAVARWVDAIASKRKDAQYDIAEFNLKSRVTGSIEDHLRNDVVARVDQALADSHDERPLRSCDAMYLPLPAGRMGRRHPASRIWLTIPQAQVTRAGRPHPQTGSHATAHICIGSAAERRCTRRSVPWRLRATLSSKVSSRHCTGAMIGTRKLALTPVLKNLDLAYERLPRRLKARPARPIATSPRVIGSGTGTT